MMNYKFTLGKNIFDSKTIRRKNNASQYVLSIDTNIKMHQTLLRFHRCFHADKITFIHTINYVNLQESLLSSLS